MQWNGKFPPYLIPGSPEEAHWRKENPKGHELMTKKQIVPGSTLAHEHVANRKYKALQKLLQRQPQLVNVHDGNGWTPLHEAVRAGNIPILKLILDHGADIYARTGKTGRGKSALELAHDFHNSNSQVVQVLKERQDRLGSEL